MDGCIEWAGAKTTSHGITYGTIGKRGLAHREAYKKAYGEIPNGLVIDHLCRNGLCVNPLHLEAVTNKENILRGFGAGAENARKTHCKRNHPLSGDNLVNRSNGRRDCKACNRLRWAVNRDRGWRRPRG